MAIVGGVSNQAIAARVSSRGRAAGVSSQAIVAGVSNRGLYALEGLIARAHIRVTEEFGARCRQVLVRRSH